LTANSDRNQPSVPVSCSPSPPSRCSLLLRPSTPGLTDDAETVLLASEELWLPISFEVPLSLSSTLVLAWRDDGGYKRQWKVRPSLSSFLTTPLHSLHTLTLPSPTSNSHSLALLHHALRSRPRIRPRRRFFRRCRSHQRRASCSLQLPSSHFDQRCLDSDDLCVSFLSPFLRPFFSLIVVSTGYTDILSHALVKKLDTNNVKTVAACVAACAAQTDSVRTLCGSSFPFLPSSLRTYL
jgi:hypothetical protein